VIDRTGDVPLSTRLAARRHRDRVPVPLGHAREPLRLNVGDPWSDANVLTSINYVKSDGFLAPRSPTSWTSDH